LEIKPIGIHDNFFDLGGTSLIAVNLFTKIEKTFKSHLSLVTLFQCPTIAQLAQMLSDQQDQTQQSAAWSTLVPIRAKGIHPPLFCVSGIHGNVLLYADLAKHLGASQPFYGLQPKGIDGIHPPFSSIEEIAAYYIQIVRTVQPKGPYFLGGFSLGSHVVWEMSQQLYQQGEKVALLALFDGKVRSTNIVRQPFRKRIFLHYQSFREMGFTYISQKFPAWQDWLSGRYQYWTKRIARRFYQKLQWKLPIYLRQSAIEESLEKAGTQAMKNYVMQVYSDKVTLFRAEIQESDQGVGFVPLDLDLGWNNLVAGGLEIQTISGDHMSMFQEPQVQILAQKLSDCLHRARETQI
jgi:thioesterase domain-containing protein/acyl carrier protein